MSKTQSKLHELSMIVNTSLGEYVKEIYKEGLKDGWGACEDYSHACSTAETEPRTLNEILEDAESALRKAF